MTIPQLAAQKMMAMFREKQSRAGFLTSFFRPIPGSTGSTGKTVLWDIERYMIAFPQRDVHLNTSQPLEIRVHQEFTQALGNAKS